MTVFYSAILLRPFRNEVLDTIVITATDDVRMSVLIHCKKNIKKFSLPWNIFVFLIKFFLKTKSFSQ